MILISQPADKFAVVERRVQGMQESLEGRFEKLNKDLKILESFTVSRSSKQDYSNGNSISIQKNNDQLMSLLSRKLQQYKFADTVIGQNHYKLVQKGLDAPSLERRIQEQRFLAEKELSSAQSTEKSMFWMDIQFSKKGIDSYLETNQNYVLFKAVDTMRAASNVSASFANRLNLRKALLQGSAKSSYTPRLDSFNSRLEQEATSEVITRAMKQLSTIGCGKFAEVLSKQSRQFKEVWLLLEKMCGAAVSSNGIGKNPHRRSIQLGCSFSRGISYLEGVYRKHKISSNEKAQQFQRIYDEYHIDQLRSIQDDKTPFWQEIYQLFRAGDYQTITARCSEYSNISIVQEFARDFQLWLNNNQKKLSGLTQKMRPNWDAFRYQIYLIMVKDPQCVDDVFIEDLDDCLWMSLKCSQAVAVDQQKQEGGFDENGDFEFVQVSEAEGIEDFYDSLLMNDSLYQESSLSKSSLMFGEDTGNSPYSWVDWLQLGQLREMLKESFKNSPTVFNSSRVLIIQLLTLDILSFVNTLRTMEKNEISQSELINMLVIVLKSGLLRGSTECAVASLSQRTEKGMKNIINATKEVEEYAEKQILMYAKDVFEVNPEVAFAYVDAIPRSQRIRLERYADLLIGSNKNYLILFKETSATSSSNKIFENHLTIVKQMLKNRDSVAGRTQLQDLARCTAGLLMKKQQKVVTALEILDAVGEQVEAAAIIIEQFRMSAAVFDRFGLNNQLRVVVYPSPQSSQSEKNCLSEALERYAEKYYGKRVRATAEYSEKDRAEDGRIVEFFKLARRVKVAYQQGEIDVSGYLKKMQDLQFVSSPLHETAASEFVRSLEVRAGVAANLVYFDFLYILYLAAARFFESLKESSFQQKVGMKPDQVARARQIVGSVQQYSNEFYAKHRNGLDKEFAKLLDSAKHDAQTAARI